MSEVKKPKSRLRKITRRVFLIGSAATVGGIAFGYWKYKQPYENPLLKGLKSGEHSLNPYIIIDQSGITIITPRAEMGQGVYTTLAAMVAEELDVDLEQVKVNHGPASHAYYNEVLLEEGVPFAPTDEGWLATKVRNFTRVPAKFLGMQITGGSSTVPDGYLKMRQAGAAAREVLMQAAAEQWGLNKAELRTESGQVMGPNGQQASYESLVQSAVGIEPPSEIKLKDPSQWRLLGQSVPRVDMVPKCTGTAQFGIDARLPDMLYATVRANPHLEAGRGSYDAKACLESLGVIKVVELPEGVAVVANNSWYAFKAADKIAFNWPEAKYPKDTAAMFAACEASFDDDHEDSEQRDDGDVDAVFAENQNQLEATYQAPFLSHSPLEPMNATAWIRDGKLDIWVGTQSPTQAVADAAEITGLEPENIHLHNAYLGGSFGRRLESDFIKQAIRIAQQCDGKPVKMTWTREEDTTHDAYRPLAVAKGVAAWDEGGPVALDLKMASPSVMSSQMGRMGLSIPGPDQLIVQGAWEQPYQIPNYRVTGYRVKPLIPISSWRSVGNSQNAFFSESFLDEVAHAAGKDPMQMRQQLLSHKPSEEVLKAVAEMADWGSAMPKNQACGVAFTLSFGVPTAEVVEIEQTDRGIRVKAVYAAVDVGTALDPRNIEAQVISGINFGLAAAIMGEITLKGGKVEQTNFHNYPILRMNQAPRIEVKILENGTKIRGIGEPGLPPVAPALANAIFALTGERIRSMPLNKSIQFA